MTADEMIEHFIRDRHLMNGKLNALSLEWEKILKRFPLTRHRTSLCKSIKSHQDYLCIHFHIGKDLRRGVCRKEWAVVRNGRQTMYVSTMFDYQYAVIHTAHFFERYRERTGRSHLTLHQAVAEFCYNTHGFSKIYDNKDGRCVYATSEGICLCEYGRESDEGKLWYRTFIPYDMLKQSQAEAWECVQDGLAKMRAHMSNCKDVGSSKFLADRDTVVRNFGNLSNETANEIYSQYFEED